MPWRFGSTEPPASEYVEAAFPERLIHTLREHQSLIRDAKERGVSLPLESLTYVEGRAPSRHPPLRVSFDFVKPHTRHVGETAPLALFEAAIAADRIAAAKSDGTRRARYDHHDQVYVPQLMQEHEEAAKIRTPKEARRQYLARMKKVQEIRKS